MRTVHRFLLAGIAAMGLAGLAAPAAAHDPAVHELTIQLPGGGTERIRYTGDVPPEVVLGSGAAPAWTFEPLAPAVFWPDAAFARLERIWADMDRQMNALMQQAETMALSPPGVSEATLADMPPGSAGYSVVSVASGNGVCTRTMRFTSTGDGAKPQVVSQSWGDCGGWSGGAGGLNAPAPLSRPGTTTIDVKAERSHSGIDPSLLHPATARRYE